MEQNTSPAASPAGGPSQDARAKAQALLAQLTGKMQKSPLAQAIEFRIGVVERQIAGLHDLIKHKLEHREDTTGSSGMLDAYHGDLDDLLLDHKEATKTVADPNSPA